MKVFGKLLNRVYNSGKLVASIATSSLPEHWSSGVYRQ